MEKKVVLEQTTTGLKTWEKEGKGLFWEKLLERISKTILDYIFHRDEKYRWDRNKPNSD